MEPVYVARDPHEKAMQRALIQYRRPENYDLVKEALIKAGRTDLIGFEKHCLITPRKMDRNTSGHKDVHKKNPSGQATRNQNNKNSNHRKQDKSSTIILIMFIALSMLSCSTPHTDTFPSSSISILTPVSSMIVLIVFPL